MVQVVNGYVCMDCADIALAKKDINPAHPPNDPNNPSSSSSSSSSSGASVGSSNTQSTPAVTFGGSLADLNGVVATPQQPGAAGQTQAVPGQSGLGLFAQSPYNPTNGSQMNLSV
jgi:hypothetical protein